MTRRFFGFLLALFCVLTFGISNAGAQVFDRGFELQQFKPATGAWDVLAVESARVLNEEGWHAGMFLNHANDSLRLVDVVNGGTLVNVVSGQTTFDFLFAYGLTEKLELGLVLPVTVNLTSGPPGAIPLQAFPTTSGGLGDLRLSGKYRLFEGEEWGVALSGILSVPTGDDSSFLGESAVTFTPRLIGDYDFADYGKVLGNVGFPIRPSRNYVNLDKGAAFQWGLGYELPAEWLLERFSFIASATGETQFASIDVEEVPFELLGGFRWRPTEELGLQTAVGRGVTDGFGAPDFRIIFGLAWTSNGPKAPPVDPDPDRDGILGAEDACPMDAEDVDEFEDADGCPELDNDADGIADLDDQCPMEPEDKDGVFDADGCPEEDGDGDAIADAADKCPEQAEDINGRDDEDGCPDSKVTVSAGKLELGEPVLFKSGSAELDKRSYDILNDVAALIIGTPEIRSMRIEGHTDSQGSDVLNQRLSERRAESVRDYLVGKGIDAGLFATQGFGESQPIDSNDTAQGRARNRRVDFYIVEIESSSDD